MFCRCYFCGKLLIKKLAEVIRVVESPKDKYGIQVFICKKCKLSAKYAD